MTEPQLLGDFIRDRRLALGFSAGQLAMRLHSTAAVVRTWERGHEPVPDDAFSGLAELLDVAEAKLRALQGPMEETLPDVVEPAVVVEPDPEPEATAVPEPGMEPEIKTDELESDSASESGPDTKSEQTEVPDEASSETEGETEPESEDGAPTSGRPPGIEIDTGLLEAPTEAIEPVRNLRTSTRSRPQTAAVATVAADPVEPPEVEPAATEVDGSVPDWLGPLKEFFDPSRRYIYWLRAIGTIIGLYIVFRVLGFALGELVEAVGDFWDSFSTPENPTIDGDVTSLGFFG